MNVADNINLFPENIQAPYDTIVLGNERTVYRYHFRGIQDFYRFLKKGPTPNYKVFGSELASIHGRKEFAGKSYDQALRELIQVTDPGYQEYLRIQSVMSNIAQMDSQYVTMKSVAGGRVDPVAFATGSPEIYRVSRLVEEPKFITIHTQIAYDCGTNSNQVLNRAIIITNLIRALERAGYTVDVKAFMMCQESYDIIEAIFDIKHQDGSINYQMLYKSLVSVEFFRRLCFRLIECASVTNGCWAAGYGMPSPESTVRALLHLREEDIYFDQPRSMHIRGDDILRDFENVMLYDLELGDIIDVDAEKKNLARGMKILQK